MEAVLLPPMRKTLLTYGDSVVKVRKAVLEDLDAIKQIADAHRNELGFIMRPALQRSIEREELYIAVNGDSVVGFVEYHHRRDEQTTLYHIAVSPEVRKRGIGTMLVEALKNEALDKGKQLILLKCPLPLPANSFYARLGWQRAAVEQGKSRPLVLWHLPLSGA